MEPINKPRVQQSDRLDAEPKKLGFRILSAPALSVVTDPLELKSIEIAGQIRDYASAEMEVAKADKDLPRFLRALSVAEYQSNDIKWILELGDKFANYSFEDFLRDQESPDNIAHYTKKAERVTNLIDLAMKGEGSEGICVALKRSRLEDGRTIRYESVAVFPSQNKAAGYWLYEPKGVACAEHCCDVLYKEARKNGNLIHLANSSLAELYAEASLEADRRSRVEFRDVMNEMQDRQAAARRELTRALLGYYGNLRKNRIPDEFLNKSA